MNPALAGVALAVVAGAVVALSAHNARTVVLGLAVVLVLSPMLADPIPDPIGLAARLVGAVLASYLLWVATRGNRAGSVGSLVGWPTETFLAIAAAVVGYGSHTVDATGTGPASAAAAGFALAALAVVPVTTGRDVLRTGIGLCLLLAGALLVVASLDPASGPFEQVLIAGLVATLGGAIATLVVATRSEDSSEPVRPAGPA